MRSALVLALALIATPALAGTLDDAQRAGVLRVGTPGDYAPFSLRQPDGSYRGADITEVQRLADHLHLKIEFVPTTWGRPIARCADRDRYTTIASIDQPGVRAVTNPGGSNEAFAHANLPHATLTVFPDNTKIFTEIIEGRQDVMVTDGVEVDHQAFRHPELCATAVAAPFTRSPGAFMLQPDPALQQAVDAFLTAELASGVWQATLTAAEQEP